jgi:hypothetical protein
VTRERATGRDVVLAIRENMRESLEPLVTETVAPSLYQVYLHPEDHDHLRTLFGKLEAEAKALLDRELQRLNRGAVPVVQRLLRRKKDAEAPVMRYVNAEGRWFVRFQEDPNGELQPGDVKVVSEFGHDRSEGYAAGSLTHRISTTRRLGRSETRRESTEAGTAHARINYEDQRGRQTYLMTKDEIVIGREAADVWVDLRLETTFDVSREHARIQRTPAGGFRIKDLSKLGTSVDGRPLPKSLEAVEGGVRDLDRWADLPDRARIDLAGVVHLEFARIGS